MNSLRTYTHLYAHFPINNFFLFHICWRMWRWWWCSKWCFTLFFIWEKFGAENVFFVPRIIICRHRVCDRVRKENNTTNCKIYSSDPVLLLLLFFCYQQTWKDIAKINVIVREQKNYIYLHVQSTSTNARWLTD